MRRIETRRYHRYNDDNEEKNILLSEFLFYNKTKKVIEEKVIQKICKELDTGKKDNIYWTNDNFAKYGVGFKFSIKTLKETSTFVDEKEIKEYEKQIYIKILEFAEDSFTTKDFNSCNNIKDRRLFIAFKPTEEQTKFLDTFKFNMEGEHKIKTLKSWDELLNYIIETKLIEYREDDGFALFVDTTKTLFPDEEVSKHYYKIVKDHGRYGGDIQRVSHIVNVIERRIHNKNYRIAFISNPSKYSDDDHKYEISVISDTDSDYLYIDTDRIRFKTGEKNYYLDDTVKEYTTNEKKESVLILYEKIFSLMMENIGDILSDGKKVITPTIYRFYRDRVDKFLDDSDVCSEREQQIIKQYKKLLLDGKQVKINDIILTRKSIELVDQSFKMEFSEKFIDVIEHFGSIKSLLNDNDVRYNLNDLYEKLLQLSKLEIIKSHNTRERDYKKFKGTGFRLNGMKFSIFKDANRIKINGIFSRINDVYYMLTKAICYRDIEEYNKYVKDSSYIGVDWKKMISSGVMLELNNPFFNIFKKTGEAAFEKMLLRFSLLWDKEHRQNIYLLLNEKKYLIKYKAKFKKYFNFPSRVITMEKLQNELQECLVEINDDIIIDIVENAVKEAKIIKKRGKELVVNTIKDIKAEKITIDINGNEHVGYKFKGRITGAVYFVRENDLDVYKFVDGQWNRRCVVDDHNKQRIFEDKLANRLVNIFNEPKKIYTLHN